MRYFAWLILSFVPLTAAADAVCDELWLTRNTVFDNNGYCFGSVLGQSIFDNSDCTTTSPLLSNAEKDLIARLQAVETQEACSIDTKRTSLDLAYIIERRTLSDLPVRGQFESVCLGYKGVPLLLTSGRHPDTAIYGEIQQGMDVFFLYEPVDGMDFVVLEEGGLGWVGSHLFTPDTCEAMAG